MDLTPKEKQQTRPRKRLAPITNSPSFNTVLPPADDIEILKRFLALGTDTTPDKKTLNHPSVSIKPVSNSKCCTCERDLASAFGPCCTAEKDLKQYSDITNQITSYCVRSTLHIIKSDSQSYRNIKIFPLNYNLPRKVRVYKESLPEPVLRFGGFKSLLNNVQYVICLIVRVSLSLPVNWCMKIRHPQNSEQLSEWTETLVVEVLNYCITWMVDEGVEPTEKRREIKLNNLTAYDFHKALNTNFAMIEYVYDKVTKAISDELKPGSKASPYYFWLSDLDYIVNRAFMILAAVLVLLVVILGVAFWDWLRERLCLMLQVT